MNNLFKRFGILNQSKFKKCIECLTLKFKGLHCTSAIEVTDDVKMDFHTQKTHTQNTDLCRQRTHAYKEFREMNGPGGKFKLPYLGLLFHFKPFGDYTSATFHKFLQEMNTKYGKIVKQRFGKSWMVFLFDPNDIEHISREEEKFPYRVENPLITCYFKEKNAKPGIAFRNSEEWLSVRKPTQEKLLKPTSVVRYTPMVEVIAEEFVDMIGKRGVLENTLMDMSRYTIEVMGMLCFDKRLDCFNATNRTTDVVPFVHGFFDDLGESYDRFPLYKFFRTKFYRKFENEYNVIRRLVQHNLDEGLEKMTTANNALQPEQSEQTFLQSMLTDPRLTTDDVCGVITDLFTAGAQTTNALTFILQHLAQNPAKQDKLHEEIRRSIDSSGSVDEKTFRNTPYLKACMKESHRLMYPLRDGVRRILDKDTVVGGYKVPKGSQLIFCNNTICLDENYFHNPSEFLPERWLRSDVNRSSIHPFACLPFGFGPRNCVGQRFSELQMHVLLSKLLLKYRVTVEERSPISFTYKIFATPDKPVKILLEKR